MNPPIHQLEVTISWSRSVTKPLSETEKKATLWVPGPQHVQS